MNFRLHNYWRSSASYRVRIALGLKGAAFEYVPVHLIKGEQKAAAFTAKNPMAQLPMLEILDGGTAPRYLTQSLAIIEYLDEAIPQPALLPGDAYQRGRIRALAEIVNAGIQPMQNLSTTNKVAELGGDDKAWVRHFMSAGLLAFHAATADVAGEFCVGNTPTLADCCLQPQLYSARRFGVDFSHLPLLVQLEQRYAELPAFANAHPDRQPDASK